MTGLTRKKASEIVAKHFQTDSQYDGGAYRAYSVKDNEGSNTGIIDKFPFPAFIILN